MLTWLARRVGYAFLILLGVNLLTFILFFKVNTPDDMARMQLGAKRVTPEAISKWKTERGLDKPLLYAAQETGLQQFTNTLFYERSLEMFALRFGSSDDGRDIAYEIRQRAWPSLALALPTFILGLFAAIWLALLMAFFRGTALDFWSGVICIIMMSISGLFYIIGGQFLFAKTLHLVPISGYADGTDSLRFLILPIVIGIIGGLGGQARWYRTLFLEEIYKDYVRTARAKGLSEVVILVRHVLRNSLIPILTGVVVIIPLLFMGSLLSESFFGIPGLGSYTIEAINAQDFNIVRAMVFIGSALYIVGLMLTDIAYTLVDPRIRLS